MNRIVKPSNKNHTSRTKNGWLIASAACFMAGLFSNIITLVLSNKIDDIDKRLEFNFTWTPLALVLLVLSISLSLVALIKVKVYMKVFPVLIILLAVLLFMLAWVSYSFSRPD